MSSVLPPPEATPYQLQTLVSTVVPQYGQGFATGPRAPAPSVKVSVTCAQALGLEIYVGCSDGSLLRFALQADAPQTPERYQLLSRQTVPTNKAVEEIALAPSLSRVLVHTDSQIHFYTLPSLDYVPSHILKPIRNVLHVIPDDQYLRRQPPQVGEQQSATDVFEFCVIKRNSIALYSLRDRLFFQKDIPFPERPTAACRSGPYLCISDSDNYNMVDLQSASMIPLVPIVQIRDETIKVKPSITVVTEGEFLILSSTGPVTMGLFLTGRGDPVRGTLQWEMHPDSICVSSPYVLAFLPNYTLEIHSLEMLEKLIQIVTVSPSSNLTSTTPSPFRALYSSYNGYFVPSTERTERLRPVSIFLTPSQSSTSSSLPSPSPPALQSRSSTQGSSYRPVFPRSNVLIISDNSIMSLLPSTFISRAEALINNGQVEEAVDLANEHRRRLQQNISHDEDKAEELRYIYQRIGFLCLEKTLFDDAAEHLQSGDADPRLLVRYFAEYRGSLFESSPTVDICAGIAEHLPSIETMEAITGNYAAPSSTVSEELKIQQESARDMLLKYLRSCRKKRELEGSNSRNASNPRQQEINSVVDTVLVKILAKSNNAKELSELIDHPNNVVLAEVERTMVDNNQFGILCRLYKKSKNDEKLLEAYSKISDGVWQAEDVSSPVTNISDILAKTKDRSLVQRWGIWLVKKDADLGLKILISRDANKTSSEDDILMLDHIHAVNVNAGVRYLEYLVLRKHSTDETLHGRLASSYANRLLQCVNDAEIAADWTEKGSLYKSQRSDTPFLSYFASCTLESEAKRTRLKTALFLQGALLPNIKEIFQQLKPREDLLSLEIAIISGRLHRHREAIHALIHDIKDVTSAEAYCTLGGDVISAKIASVIGEKYGLADWAALVTGSDARQKTADEVTKKELLRILLEAYMSEGDSTLGHTTRLINSQAMNLDVSDVISLVPPDWPLASMSSFLIRSFRRTLHEQHEGYIIKAISAGQNLEVTESSWMKLREQGATLEEPLDNDDEQTDAAGASVDEKAHLMEKFGLAEGLAIQESVAEILPDPHKRAITDLTLDDFNSRTNYS